MSRHLQSRPCEATLETGGYRTSAAKSRPASHAGSRKYAHHTRCTVWIGHLSDPPCAQIKCVMRNGEAPCVRCRGRGLPCTVNKSLQMLMEDDAV